MTRRTEVRCRVVGLKASVELLQPPATGSCVRCDDDEVPDNDPAAFAAKLRELLDE